MAAKVDSSAAVLILAPIGRDAAVCASVLEPAGFATQICKDMESLCAAMSENAGLAIVTEEALSPGALQQLEAKLATQNAWSDFPLVIFTIPSSQRYQPRVPRHWQELGHVTVLDRPVRGHILVSAAQSALRSRLRQFEARDAIRQRDEFLAMLGHELRNPLAAIAFAVERSLQLTDAQAPISKPLGVIERQTKQLARLVDDLLDVARVTSGKVVLRKTPLEVNQFVKHCLQPMQSIMQANSLTVSIGETAKPLVTMADPERFEQVITNLLNNAIKYTPSGGHIDIELSEENGMACIRVRDTGIGIEAPKLEQIFELFQQVDGALDRSRGGLGIGLTLIKRLVELHGGTVRAQSGGLGRGSEFNVCLPAVAANESVAAASRTESQAMTTGRRVVIVEDNADIRETLVEVLQDLGHTVEAAEDGATGVDLIASFKPAVALVDIGLPILDGYQVAEKVRARQGDDVYLIALTGYGQRDDKERARTAGFDSHVTKPIKIDTLEKLLAEAPARA